VAHASLVELSCRCASSALVSQGRSGRLECDLSDWSLDSFRTPDVDQVRPACDVAHLDYRVESLAPVAHFIDHDWAPLDPVFRFYLVDQVGRWSVDQFVVEVTSDYRWKATRCAFIVESVDGQLHDAIGGEKVHSRLARE